MLRPLAVPAPVLAPPVPVVPVLRVRVRVRVLAPVVPVPVPVPALAPRVLVPPVRVLPVRVPPPVLLPLALPLSAVLPLAPSPPVLPPLPLSVPPSRSPVLPPRPTTTRPRAPAALPVPSKLASRLPMIVGTPAVRWRGRGVSAFGVFLVVWLVCGPAWAVCLDLARKAERLFGVPAPILQAIVLTESGDNPLALNVGGASVFPKTEAEARQVIRQSRQSRVNVDIGCGQISLTYHKQFFGVAPEMALDPWINVVYMAREVLNGYKRQGSWAQAVAVYHSGTPQRQREYLCKVAGQVLKLTHSRNVALKSCHGKG